MIEEKEIAFRHLLAEAEEIMVRMYSDILMSGSFVSEDWKGKITAWGVV